MTYQHANQPPFENLQDWLFWLETTRPEIDIKLGLERIIKVAKRLNLTRPAPFVITVGGTNGKGSTVALLEAILLEAGYSTGVYTSPHLVRFNERIKVKGKEVSDQSLAESFNKVNEGRGADWLSYFEFAVLVAVDCFKKADVDIALMEVGIGGRLDATNMIDPDVSVITTVGLDHQDWLGYGIDAIGTEKAGIMRSDTPAVFGAYDISQPVLKYAINIEAALHRRGQEFDIHIGSTDWTWKGYSRIGEKITLAHLPFPSLVIDNAATAIQALQFLPEPVSRAAIEKGLQSATLSGRYEKIIDSNQMGANVQVILDVAHNPQAAEMLATKLKVDPVAGKTRAVLAMYGDKDCAGVIEALVNEVDEWVVTEFDSPRAIKKEELIRLLEARELTAKLESSVRSAYEYLVEISEPEDRVLVTGSFMTVALPS